MSAVSTSTRETVQRLLEEAEREAIVEAVARPVAMTYLAQTLARLRRGDTTPMQFHLIALVESVTLLVRTILGQQVSPTSLAQTLRAVALLIQVRADALATPAIGERQP
jgi:hypothetical protein